MIEKLKEYELKDEVMDQIEGGIGTPENAKRIQLSNLGNILHFGKNVAGNNSIFKESKK